MSNGYERYWAELREGQKPERQNVDTEINGFYRMKAAKTKPDYPVSIFEADGQICVNIGHAATFTTEGEATRWHEFLGDGWLWCDAVEETDYREAMDKGKWPSDGKPARKLSAEQRADIIPDTPAEQGGNNPDGETQTYDQQIDARLKVEIRRWKALGVIDTLEKAQTAADILDKIQELGKLGNQRRERDRKPHLEAAQVIQNTWLAVLTPASDLVKPIKQAIIAFQEAERRRLQKIADDEAAAAAKIRAAEAEAIRVENERLASLAAAKGAPAPEPIQPPIPEAELPKPKPVEAPKVAAAFGKAVSVAKLKKGRITNETKFINAIKKGADFKEFIQTKANALARAGTAVNGMEIVIE